jgi:RNA polymerase sigma-70 factor (ECF subfamily)
MAARRSEPRRGIFGAISREMGERRENRRPVSIDRKRSRDDRRLVCTETLVTTAPQTLSMLSLLAGGSAGSEPRPLEAGVREAQAGDVGAFERVYRENVGRVYALCVRLCADTVHAEQLTQDTFVRAWERLGSFRGESSLATWLRHVTVSVVLDDRRASARRERRVMTTDDDEVLEAPGRDRGADAGIDLERAIAALPEGARTVFVLHDIEGYQHDEIAALTGIAEGTSKAQLHRARTRIKEVLR